MELQEAQEKYNGTYWKYNSKYGHMKSFLYVKEVTKMFSHLRIEGLMYETAFRKLEDGNFYVQAFGGHEDCNIYIGASTQWQPSTKEEFESMDAIATEIVSFSTDKIKGLWK